MVCSRCPKEFRFYETVLKRKCLKKLKNNVWENKTKWTLIKKADNHLRKKLLYKYFNLWIRYIYERYRKKINDRAGRIHYEEKLKTKVFLALKRNVEQNRMLLRISKRKFECSLKYRCWHQWKHYVQKRLKVREVKVLADRIREERLRIRFFYMWVFCLNERRLLKLSVVDNHVLKMPVGGKIGEIFITTQKRHSTFLQNAVKALSYYTHDGYKLAVVKHEAKLKEKCFKYWKIFTKKKICKAKIEKLAIACYKDKLKEKYIRCWKNYTTQKNNYKYQMNVIQNFYNNYILKNYLNQWWIAYRNLEQKNQIYKSNLAVNFHDRKLLYKGFKTLCQFRAVKKARRDKMHKFHDVYVKIYINFYLNVWVEKLSEKIVWNVLENKANEWREDYLRELFFIKFFELYQKKIEEKEEWENVIKYSNAIIIHRAFRGWREVADNKIQKKIQLENASKYYTDKIVKNSFEKWKKFLLKRSRKKMAADYYRFILLLRIMTLWKIFIRKRKLKLAEAVILERKYKTRLMRNAFECWKDETEISKSKLKAAVYFYDRLSLSRAFHTWRKNSRLKTVNKSRFFCNKAILNDILVKNMLFRWYKVLLVNENVNKKCLEFKSRQEKRALSLYFNTWYRFVDKMRCLRQYVVVYDDLKSSILIEQYLFVLLEAVRSKRIYDKKVEVAGKIEEKFLKRRYLRKWLCFIAWKREKIQKCVPDQRKVFLRDGCEFFTPVGKSTRRQPMIPGYLKADFMTEQFQEEDTINQKTYRVERPVNKNIPIIGPKESFVCFEI